MIFCEVQDGVHTNPHAKFQVNRTFLTLSFAALCKNCANCAKFGQTCPVGMSYSQSVHFRANRESRIMKCAAVCSRESQLCKVAQKCAFESAIKISMPLNVNERDAWPTGADIACLYIILIHCHSICMALNISVRYLLQNDAVECL